METTTRVGSARKARLAACRIPQAAALGSGIPCSTDRGSCFGTASYLLRFAVGGNPLPRAAAWGIHHSMRNDAVGQGREASTGEAFIGPPRCHRSDRRPISDRPSPSAKRGSPTRRVEEIACGRGTFLRRSSTILYLIDGTGLQPRGGSVHHEAGAAALPRRRFSASCPSYSRCAGRKNYYNHNLGTSPYHPYSMIWRGVKSPANGGVADTMS